MHFRKALLVLFLAVIGGYAEGQVRSSSSNSGKSMYTQKRFNNAARVSGQKAKIVCPVFENSKYPYQGFGFKLGDPFAFTYKYYATKNLSLVADVGRPSSALYNQYFRSKFIEYQPSDTVNYLSHKVNSDYVGELKILYQFNAKKVSPGLQVYVGAGWEWRATKLTYSYTTESSSTGTGGLNEIANFDARRFTQGPQAIIGIEYAYFQIPISAFMEVEYFFDVLADPGWGKVQGGVGLRYVF